MAKTSEVDPAPRGRDDGVPVALIVVLLLAAGAVLAAFLLGSRWGRQAPKAPVLTDEARAYVRANSLRLSDVEINAKESYARQTLVEITGKITNSGNRAVKLVEIYCVFYDTAGLVVLRERLPIVSARTGGLKPGETKSFRLPFDTIPASWSQQLPQLVIAQIIFG